MQALQGLLLRWKPLSCKNNYSKVQVSQYVRVFRRDFADAAADEVRYVAINGQLVEFSLFILTYKHIAFHFYDLHNCKEAGFVSQGSVFVLEDNGSEKIMGWSR